MDPIDLDWNELELTESELLEVVSLSDALSHDPFAERK